MTAGESGSSSSTAKRGHPDTERTEPDACGVDEAETPKRARVAAEAETGADADGGKSGDKKETEGKPAGKARVAVLFGYCGSGYKGSQLNPGMPTIEAELMKAFVAAGAITAENNDPKKVGLNRCARTDKGVHAAGNVISLKLRIIPNLVQAINAHLPKQIRIYDCLRVTSSFNAKNHCGGRQYEYCMPTYMLRKSCKSRYPYSNLPDPATVQTDKKEHEESCEMGGTSWVVVDKSESYEELIKFRVADTELEHLREVLKGYEGTHNFHNFTVGVKFNQKNSGRYITSFAAADPFIRSDGTQWIRLFVNGQSFMLHQIRKMVSFAVMAVRTGTPATVVAATYGEEKLNVPKAPALGLLLRKPLFEAYNRQQQKLHADRAPLEFGPYENIIEPFLDEWVQPDMYAEEHERHIYAGWLERVDAHSLDFAWWLTAEGAVRPDLKPAGGVVVDEDEVGGAVEGQRVDVDE